MNLLHFAFVPFLLSVGLEAQGTLHVLASSPANNTRNAGTATPWVVTFDRPVNAASLNGNVHVWGRWSGAVPGQASLDAAGTHMTFQPSRPMFPGETVHASLTHNVAAQDSTLLAGGFVVWFWTAPASGTGTYTLANTLHLRTGTAPLTTYGAHAGDIDGDGSPDILACNELTSDIRVFRNDGCGVPGPMAIHAGAGEPSPNESADFDGDGRLDLVTGNQQGNSVAVFLNNGNGGFLPPIVLPTGGVTHGVTVIDADSDGRPDIATTNRSSVLLFRNLGGGNFAAPVTFQAGNGEDGIAAADANNDGKADLFVACFSGGTVAVLLGDGNGNFTLAGSRNCGGNPFQIAVGDIDGDGNCDAITANQSSNSLGVMRGDGLGGLVSTVTYPSGSGPAAADLGDLDGDGDLDAVISNYSSGNYTVFTNLGNGTFSTSLTLPGSQNGSCATLVDFDRDGLLDILATDEGADEIRIYLQNRPPLPGVQPIHCLATMRVDNWAIGGYGGRPLRPVRAGGTTFFGVSAAANVPFAVMLGVPQLPAVPFPFGLANLDPNQAGVLVMGFLGDPRAVTNGFGEASVAIPVPAGLTGAIYSQAVVLDPRAGPGLLFSNPVGIAFTP